MTVLTRGPEELPAALVERGRRRPVARIQDGWRIDDEWWRDPINRRYYRVMLDDGSLRTLYHNLADDRWYEQSY
ncbi:MAG: hypothetical protein AVDCRST_MAG19-792 [uncultured Thermomicrobiales bacterium]|uniref:Uncharacterized protein n=1 Tax=uncultured Thermomicrobiales bacterium TaxID=1645740 RepID=A0A6J4ULT8_9BACT|nr:MAG: hypothetical protein AVDCRST_MAG19-792 [uncultured Thermomicrobiales bacterium]